MSETITSFLVIFSEVGVLLALVAIIVGFFVMRRKHKDNILAHQVVETLRESESARKANLMDILQKVHEVDEEFASQTAHAMLASEKRIYNRVLKMFLGHERDGILDLQKDVENMATTYRKLIDSIKAMHVSEPVAGDSPKRDAQLRIQIKQLEAEKQKLQEDLDESMASMENMLKEYTQMYAGGGAKKEGLKHIENELSQLKHKIAKNLVDDVEEGDDVPDISPDSAPGAKPAG
jgi:DNA repair exonuclease SbcCD ATPase subunit